MDMTAAEFDSLLSIYEAGMRFAKLRGPFGVRRIREAMWYLSDYVWERVR